MWFSCQKQEKSDTLSKLLIIQPSTYAEVSPGRAVILYENWVPIHSCFCLIFMLHPYRISQRGFPQFPRSFGTTTHPIKNRLGKMRRWNDPSLMDKHISRQLWLLDLQRYWISSFSTNQGFREHSYMQSKERRILFIQVKRVEQSYKTNDKFTSPAGFHTNALTSSIHT